MPAPIISAEKIREAVAHYLECGSLAESGRRMGLAESTLVRWRWRPEWHETVQAYERELDAKFAALLRKQFCAATQKAIDRVEQGDVRVTRDGQLIPVPVSARDSALVAGMALDRLRLLQGRPQKLSATYTIAEKAKGYADAGRVAETQQDVAETPQQPGMGPIPPTP